MPNRATKRSLGNLSPANSIHLVNPVNISTTRREAATTLTKMIDQDRSFSFLRLGDGEVRWMLAMQKHEKLYVPYQYRPEEHSNCEMALGVQGLLKKDYERLLKSYEQCSYLDYCDNIPSVAQLLETVHLPRDPKGARNPSPETANIILDWTYLEFPKYQRGHRCLFASAEADITKELFKDKTYREIAGRFWDFDCEHKFYQILDDGRNYAESLDIIKNDLAKLIIDNKVDSLFLSLATGAKILCYELAKELSIRAIDWGAMSRALIFCGSPGYHTVRSDHNIFLFRVPFDVYMNALEKARPQMSNVQKISKAHAQLCLELQPKIWLKSTPADVNGGGVDLSRDSVRFFKKGLRYYKKTYKKVILEDERTKTLDRIFRRWYLKRGIGFSGKLFLFIVYLKGVMRRALTKKINSNRTLST